MGLVINTPIKSKKTSRPLKFQASHHQWFPLVQGSSIWIPREGLGGRDMSETLAICPLRLLGSILPILDASPTWLYLVCLLTKAPHGFPGHAHHFAFPGGATPAWNNPSTASLPQQRGHPWPQQWSPRWRLSLAPLPERPVTAHHISHELFWDCLSWGRPLAWEGITSLNFWPIPNGPSLLHGCRMKWGEMEPVVPRGLTSVTADPVVLGSLKPAGLRCCFSEPQPMKENCSSGKK